MRARRPRTARSVPDALTALCRGEMPDLPADPTVQAQLVTAVRHHRIAPLAHVGLRDLSPDVAARLRPDRDAAIAMHLRTSGVLDRLARLLPDVPWATFKGPVLSELAHPVPGLRSYRDLDVLVPPDALRDVASRFAGAGWTVADWAETLTLPEVRGEMHWRTPAGVMIDLHWSMLNMAAERRSLHVVTDDLLARRRTTRLGLTSAPVLDPVDAFVHVCLHAAMSGADRMLMLLDVDQLARQVADWDCVVARARQWRGASAMALVLRRTQAVLGTPLPYDIDRRLGSSRAFASVTRLTDRLVGVPGIGQDASLARLVSRSVRPSTSATFGALGIKGVRAAWGLLLPPAEARAEHTPADARALEAYLRAVEDELQGARQWGTRLSTARFRAGQPQRRERRSAGRVEAATVDDEPGVRPHLAIDLRDPDAQDR